MSQGFHNKMTVVEVIELPMIQVSIYRKKKNLCFFAGVGFDSLMLNDFKEIEEMESTYGYIETDFG